MTAVAFRACRPALDPHWMPFTGNRDVERALPTVPARPVPRNAALSVPTS